MEKLDEDVADFCNSRIIKHEEGYLYVSAPGYKLYTPIFGPYPEDQEEAMDFARALKVFVINTLEAFILIYFTMRN